MEKVLVSFDEFKYNQLISEAKSKVKNVQRFVDDINAINDFKIDSEHLKDLLFSTGEKTLKEILDETQKQIDKAGIRSKSLINSVIAQDQDAFERLFSSFYRPDVQICLLLSIDKLKLILNKQAVEDAKEKFCVYIETEKGLKKQEEYKKFIEAANSFFSDNKLFKGPLNLLHFFNLTNDNTFTPIEMSFDLM